VGEVALFTNALSPAQLQAIFYAANVSPALKIQLGPGAGQITLTWVAGTLQQADQSTGPFTNVPGASSPYVTSSASGARFYRTR
jgi:hypothetical protein